MVNTNNIITERNKESLNKTKEVKTDLLTPEEREKISDIININIGYNTKYYNENRNDEKKLSLLGDNYDSVEDYICYNKQVNKVKEIFTNIKKRVTDKKEQEKVAMLEENALNIMKKLIQGIDYWEDLELREYNKWLQRELQEAWSAEDTHIETIQFGKELVEAEIEKKTKDLREENREKTKNLDKLGKSVVKKDLQISELQREIQQLKTNLEKANKTIEKKELEISDLHLTTNEKLAKADAKTEEKIKMLEKKVELNTKLFTKKLPSLPKNPNKLKLLGKLKTKCQQFKQFVKKQKVQEQELVCQVEVRT